MAKKTRADEDPNWVCVNSLIHGGAVFRHGDTYLASETEAVRRDQPESFIPWPALPDEIRRANRRSRARRWNRSRNPNRRRSGQGESGRGGA